MNVVFDLRPEFAERRDAFLEFMKANNVIGIKGHRSLGGFRASIYNSQSFENCTIVRDLISQFENQ